MIFLYWFISLSIIISYIYYYQNNDIKAIFIFLTACLLNVHIPLFGKDLELFYLLMIVSLLIIFSKKSYRIRIALARNNISNYVLVFYLLFFLSILFNRLNASILGVFQLIIDFTLLYFVFVPIFVLYDSKKILKIIVYTYAIFLFFGLVSYLIEDPWFGQMYYYDVRIEGAEKASSYYEKLSSYYTQGRDISSATTLMRLKFSTSDSNSMGLMGAMMMPIIFYFIKSAKIRRDKIIAYIILLLSIYSVVLSGSRTAFISLVVVLFVILKLNYKPIYFVTGLVLFMVFGALGMYFLPENLIFLRFQSILTIDDLMDANNRMSRWLYHFENLNINYLFLGNSFSGFMGGGSRMAHNNFLLIIYRSGFISLIIYLLILIKTVIYSKRIDPQIAKIIIAMLAGYLVAGITLDIMTSVGPNYLFWAIMALLVTKSSDKTLHPNPISRSKY
jgi:hypothetical protein